MAELNMTDIFREFLKTKNQQVQNLASMTVMHLLFLCPTESGKAPSEPLLDATL